MPPADILTEGLDQPAVSKALLNAHFAKMDAVFQSTHVLIAAAPPVTVGIPPTPEARQALAADWKHIYFRQRTPMIVSTFAIRAIARAGAKEKSDQLVQVGSSIEQLMHPYMAPGSLVLDRSAFSTRQLALEFDSKGEPTKLQRKTTSSADAATGSLATAASSALDTYQTTLGTVQKINQVRRDIRLDRIKGEIASVTEQKNLIDTRLSLEGANATADLVRQKQSLDAQLAAKQSEYTLEQKDRTAELNQLQDQLAIATAQFNVDQQSATVQLLLGQAQLKAQLDSLSAQLNLDKAQAGAQDVKTLNDLQRQIQILRQQIDLINAKNDLKAAGGT